MLDRSSGAVWRTVTPPSPTLTTALCEISGAAGEERRQATVNSLMGSD